MKTIIVPVDFSAASANALSFAAELSNRASARLIVINVRQKGESKEDAEEQLRLIKSDLTCETMLLQGSLVNALKKVIEGSQPDMVVMGTKGASGLKRIVIGSNTVNVLAKTKIPVLVIPEVASFKNFLKKGKNRIVLATDLEEFANDDALDLLKEIALLLIEPKLRVLSVRPRNTKLTYFKNIQRDLLIHIFQPEIDSERVTVFSSNVIRGIELYLSKKSKDTGLLAMIARDSGNLMKKHYTRAMASHTHLPLLILHDK
jgi:nucleotide-binding universal stress UspA family protein